MTNHRSSGSYIPHSGRKFHIGITLHALDTRTLPERVVERLRDLMIGGTLRPGARLTEREIAQQLGVSKTVIREAFLRLETDGFLQRQRNKETRVTLLTRKQVER